MTSNISQYPKWKERHIDRSGGSISIKILRVVREGKAWCLYEWSSNMGQTKSNA